MLNYIIKIIFKKHIVLISKHRQTLPIIKNNINRKTFIFISEKYLWRLIPIPSKFKIKYKLVYFILNIINPKIILTINWISKWESLYKVWTKNHPESKFIVVQHGSYFGGIVTDVKHRYTKCDVFLTWGNYFTKIFKNYNKRKNVKIISFGNPIYNQFERNMIKLKNNNTSKILLIFTAIKSDDINYYYHLINLLKQLNFDVYLKMHNFQGKKIKINKKEIYYPEILNVKKIDFDTIKILNENNFDFIISDISTVLLDAIFFKNKVIYFAPSEKYYKINTKYSEYLENLYFKIDKIKEKKDIYKFINVEAQENLLNELVILGDNNLINIT
ncbi:hypothetical protein ACX8XN_04395 [Calditrichota bacterium GD2]